MRAKGGVAAAQLKVREINAHPRAHGLQPLSIVSLLSCVLLWTAASAAGGPPPGTSVTGTVTKFDGKVLTVKTKDHENLSISVAAGASLIEDQAIKFSDLRVNEFIGTTAVEQKDGKLLSREIHIFPEAMRGFAEGHGPLGEPGVTMTNGTVSDKNQNGNVFKVAYKGGEKQIEVGPDTSVKRMVVSNTSIIKPGAQVLMLTEQTKDGWIAKQVTVLPK